jgi:hypothetical protein
MISYEKFSNYLAKLQKDYEYMDKVTDILNTDMFYDNLGNSIDVAVDLLRTVMHDTGDWIGYWIYELDFGRKYKSGDVIDVNGVSVPFCSARELYDYLCNCVNSKEVEKY